MPAEFCEQWGDELMPLRTEFTGLSAAPSAGHPRQGRSPKRVWLDVGAAADYSGVVLPSQSVLVQG